MTERKMPSDVYEESGCRLPVPDRSTMSELGQKLFDDFASPKGGSLVGLWGPGGIRLHSPELSLRSREVLSYFRNEATMNPHDREVAILITAREHDNQFEWAAHEPEAVRQGVSPETIDVIKHRKSLDGLSDTDAAIIQLGRELFGQRRVSQETFAKAHGIFGNQGLVDIVSLMGLYVATATLLTAFDIQLHPGQDPLLPMP